MADVEDEVGTRSPGYPHLCERVEVPPHQRYARSEQAGVQKAGATIVLLVELEQTDSVALQSQRVEARRRGRRRAGHAAG